MTNTCKIIWHLFLVYPLSLILGHNQLVVRMALPLLQKWRTLIDMRRKPKKLFDEQLSCVHSMIFKMLWMPQMKERMKTDCCQRWIKYGLTWFIASNIKIWWYVILVICWLFIFIAIDFIFIFLTSIYRYANDSYFSRLCNYCTFLCP